VDALDWGEDWVSRRMAAEHELRSPRDEPWARPPGHRDGALPWLEAESLSVEELPTESGKGRAVVVSRPDRHDLFLFATDGVARVNGVEMDADAALVRRRSPHAT
jgi:hypothetical protein